MLEVKNITKKIDGQVILDDVSITIKPGCITSVLGPSGAGKTHLLETVSMLQLPQKGSISIDGEVYKFPMDNKSSKVNPWPKLTVVFQQLFIWPHLTVKENILLALGEKISNKQEKQFNELIEDFSIKDLIDRYPNQISLGQGQRVAIVRALMLNPKYLFLDEVTASQDIEHRLAISSYLKKVKERGVGILIVTHFLNFAKDISDQMIFFDKGKVLASGGNDLFSSSKDSRIRQFSEFSDKVC